MFGVSTYLLISRQFVIVGFDTGGTNTALLNQRSMNDTSSRLQALCSTAPIYCLVLLPSALAYTQFLPSNFLRDLPGLYPMPIRLRDWQCRSRSLPRRQRPALRGSADRRSPA